MSLPRLAVLFVGSCIVYMFCKYLFNKLKIEIEIELVLKLPVQISAFFKTADSGWQHRSLTEVKFERRSAALKKKPKNQENILPFFTKLNSAKPV